MFGKAGGFEFEGRGEEGVGPRHGTAIGCVEGEGEGTIEEVGEGGEGGGWCGKVEEEEGCYCLLVMLVGIC